MLANRQKQRMSEAQSTLSKRLTWASQQVAKSQQQGLFDATIVNTTMDEVMITALPPHAEAHPVCMHVRRSFELLKSICQLGLLWCAV